MDAKTRDLALLAALSLFCTGVAWIWGYVILGSVFFALGGVAALGLGRRLPASPASGTMTTATCCVRAQSSAAS